MRKMIAGLVAFILLVSISSVFAAGGKRPIPMPEPLGYLLVATGGASLAGLRYWMAKRRSKKDTEVPSDVQNE